MRQILQSRLYNFDEDFQWSSINLSKISFCSPYPSTSPSFSSRNSGILPIQIVPERSRVRQRNELAPMSALRESKYLLSTDTGQNRHSQHSPQDLAPYSAVCFRNCGFPFWTLQEQSVSDQQHQVSSFNLPPFCDSSLITPVSMTQPPTMTTKTAPILKSAKDMKLSPSALSPTFQFMAGDDDYNGRYSNNPPMKHKYPSGPMNMSASDSSFPISPYVCPEPFWGPYGVSATPVSRRSESSPSVNPSPPQLHSAGGLSNTSSSYSRQQTSAQNASSYRTQNQAPILIAPSPSVLRPATDPSRQNSLQSISMAPSSATVGQGPFPESFGSSPPRGKKRKSPSRDSREKAIVLAEEKTLEEEVLLDLSYKQRLPWKQVQKKFMEKFPNGKEVAVSTLQMRKKRLIDRLRIWTDEDVIAPPVN